MISIIVPVYNSESTVFRCIDSILTQSYRDIEVLIIDDGSTDTSAKICKSFINSNCKYFFQHNSGVSAARNNGLSHATGDYIMFLDSDDYLRSDMCQKLLQIMESDHADIVICGTEENDGTLWRPEENVKYLTFNEFKVDFVKHLNSELLSPVWNKIFRKSLITKLFTEGMSFGEDLVFNLNYLTHCSRISFTTECPHFHDKSSEKSLVRKIDLKRLHDIETIEKAILDFSYNNKYSALYDKYLRDLSVYIRQIAYCPILSTSEKIKILRDWRGEAILGEVNLLNSHLNWKNLLFMIMCKRKMWLSIMIFSQIKTHPTHR